MLSYFSHGVGESFKLKGCHLRDCFELKSFAGVGACFTVFAEILVSTLKFVNCEETGNSLM